MSTESAAPASPASALERASEVFGGTEEATHWMSSSALGLDGQRPIDLLQTTEGAEQVMAYLTRLEFGVYC